MLHGCNKIKEALHTVRRAKILIITFTLKKLTNNYLQRDKYFFNLRAVILIGVLNN